MDTLFEELKEAGWNVLHDHPGVNVHEWIDFLFREYPAEVVDVFGSNENKIKQSLTEWWDTEEYLDPVTGISCTFSVWAKYFANEKTVALYHMLEEALTQKLSYRQ